MHCLGKVTHSLWTTMWSESQSGHHTSGRLCGVLDPGGGRKRRGRSSPAAPPLRILGAGGQLPEIVQVFRQISVHQSPVAGQLYSPVLQVASLAEPVHEDAP